MSPRNTPGREASRSPLLVAAALLAGLAGCYGPRRITYVDSSLRAPKRERTVASPSECPAGVARIETSSSWAASMIEVVSFSLCAGRRDVVYVCAEEP